MHSILFSCRKPFLDSLIVCLTSCIKTNGLESLNLIIRALPFYHWLICDPPHKPFSQFEVALDKNFQEIGKLIPRNVELKYVLFFYNKIIYYLHYRTLNTLLKDKYCCLLIEADPLLQILIFRICPKQKYCSLLDHIIPSVMIMGISQKFAELQSYTSERVWHFKTPFIVYFNFKSNLDKES